MSKLSTQEDIQRSFRSLTIIVYQWNRLQKMNKHIFLILWIVWGDCLAISGQTTDKPNIVIILADDMGYGDLSCNNPHARIRTVHIDELAKKGMRFTAAHASSGICTPSRYTLLTGRYNWRTRIKSGGIGGAYAPPLIDSSRLTIADMLRQKGYRTACIGKWHLGLEFTTVDGKSPYFNTGSGKTNIAFDKPLLQGPNDAGFDYFFGIGGSADLPPYIYIRNREFTGHYDTIKGITKDADDLSQLFRPGPASHGYIPERILPDITTEATDFIRQQSEDTPFFLYFSLTAPHLPVAPGPAFKGKSGVSDYLAFCLEVDHTVGEIVKALKEKDLYDNTLIIFTADNGYAPYVDLELLEENGHYPSYIYRGYKADVWEGGHRIPLIAAWTGKIAPRTVTDEVVSLADWFATAAELTGFAIPDDAGEDSYSLLPLLSGKHYKRPLREATVFSSGNGRLAIQQDQWKLILCKQSEANGPWVPDKRYDSSAAQGGTPFMLFDLRADPEETNNLYNRYPEKVRQLTRLLAGYIRKGRSTKGKPQQNDRAKQWPQIKWMEDADRYIH